MYGKREPNFFLVFLSSFFFDYALSLGRVPQNTAVLTGVPFLFKQELFFSCFWKDFSPSALPVPANYAAPEASVRSVCLSISLRCRRFRVRVFFFFNASV